jgi:hypothetical protein
MSEFPEIQSRPTAHEPAYVTGVSWWGRAMMEWQAIETAPRDGRRVLLWLPERGPAWGYWGMPPQDVVKSEPCWHDGEHAFSHPWGWRPPSHWLPLVPPPGQKPPVD